MDAQAAAARDVRTDELFAALPDDPTARDELVALHAPLAESLAKRYGGYGEPFEDLVQVATLGLLKAIDRFDPERGTPFAAYATPTILGELKRHFRDRGWAVRVPRRLQEAAQAIKEAMDALSQELGRSPTVLELSHRTGEREDDVLEALDALQAYTAASLDAPAGEDADNPPLGEALESEDPRFEIAEGWASLAPHIEALPERERRILALRFFEGWTQSRIAEEIGVSQMHVSRLLSKTLARLREAVAEHPE